MASTEEEYHFVEQPKKDYFCPVTYGLLLQPHLTLCCGKHLSQEATTRIEGERGACPLCKESCLSTVLNKHFLREVHELHVFCPHENRGCGWQGELSDLKRHVQSCPMKTAPLISPGTGDDVIRHWAAMVIQAAYRQYQHKKQYYKKISKLRKLRKEIMPRRLRKKWNEHPLSTSDEETLEIIHVSGLVVSIHVYVLRMHLEINC